MAKSIKIANTVYHIVSATPIPNSTNSILILRKPRDSVLYVATEYTEGYMTQSRSGAHTGIRVRYGKVTKLPTI